MACVKNLRTDFLTGADTGGTWQYLGYHASNPAGTPGAGGTDPGTLTGDNPQLDFTAYVPGFYFFRYSGGEVPCDGSVDIVIPVAPAPCIGAPDDIAFCEANCDADPNPVGGSNAVEYFVVEQDCNFSVDWHDFDLEQAPDSPDEFPAGFLNNWINGDENWCNLAIGVYKVKATVSLKAISGFTFDCDDCDSVDHTLTITVREEFNAGTPTNIAVCN